MKQLLFSFKKECWEYHTSFFTLPITLATILLMLPLLALLSNASFDVFIFKDFQNTIQLELADNIHQVIPYSVLSIFALFSFLVQIFYFTNCLFEEKRDLSVFFWRSLPVSDLQTILVKLITGALLIPCIFTLAASFLYICLMLLIASVLWFGYQISISELIFSLPTLKTFAAYSLLVINSALWLLPLYAWLMLASVSAKKTPFLQAVIPVVLIILLESILVNWFSWPNDYIYQALLYYFYLSDISTINNVGIDVMTIYSKNTHLYGFMVAGILLYLCYMMRKRIML